MDPHGSRTDAAPALPWSPAAPARGTAAPDRAPALPWLPGTGPTPGPIAGPARRSPAARDVVAGLRARGPVVGAAVVLVLALVAAVVGVGYAVVGGSTVTTPFLSYTAPAGWTAEPTGAAPPDTATLVGAVRGPAYDCGGQEHVRGFAAAALLPVDPTAAADGAAERAERLARWFAAAAYAGGDGRAPAVALAPARPTSVAGPGGPVVGAVVEATVHVAGHGDCPATTGTVVALAAPVSGGAATLLVSGDTAGGPAAPAPVDRATLDAVLASVRLA